MAVLKACLTVLNCARIAVVYVWIKFFAILEMFNNDVYPKVRRTDEDFSCVGYPYVRCGPEFKDNNELHDKYCRPQNLDEFDIIDLMNERYTTKLEHMNTNFKCVNMERKMNDIEKENQLLKQRTQQLEDDMKNMMFVLHKERSETRDRNEQMERRRKSMGETREQESSGYKAFEAEIKAELKKMVILMDKRLNDLQDRNTLIERRMKSLEDKQPIDDQIVHENLSEQFDHMRKTMDTISADKKSFIEAFKSMNNEIVCFKSKVTKLKRNKSNKKKVLDYNFDELRSDFDDFIQPLEDRVELLERRSPSITSVSKNYSDKITCKFDQLKMRVSQMERNLN